MTDFASNVTFYYKLESAAAVCTATKLIPNRPFPFLLDFVLRINITRFFKIKNSAEVLVYSHLFVAINLNHEIIIFVSMPVDKI